MFFASSREVSTFPPAPAPPPARSPPPTRPPRPAPPPLPPAPLPPLSLQMLISWEVEVTVKFSCEIIIICIWNAN